MVRTSNIGNQSPIPISKPGMGSSLESSSFFTHTTNTLPITMMTSSHNDPYRSFTISRDNSSSDLFDPYNFRQSRRRSRNSSVNSSIYSLDKSHLNSSIYSSTTSLDHLLVPFELHEEPLKQQPESLDQELLVQTVGELSMPSNESNRNLRALGLPLGSVPGQGVSSPLEKPSSSIPLGELPSLGSGPLGSVPLGSVPLGSVPGSAPLGSVPGGVPLGSVPTMGTFSSPVSDNRRGPLMNTPLAKSSSLTLTPASLSLGNLGSAPLGSVPGHFGGIRGSSESSEDELLQPTSLTLPPSGVPLGHVPLGSFPSMRGDVKSSYEDDLLDNLTSAADLTTNIIKKDSGVLSGDFSEIRGGVADGMSENGEDVVEIQDIIPSTRQTGSGLNSDLEFALSNLSPYEIQRRRNKLGESNGRFTGSQYE